MIKPVVIDDRGRIVAGHGIWLPAKKLGLSSFLSFASLICRDAIAIRTPSLTTSLRH